MGRAVGVSGQNPLRNLKMGLDFGAVCDRISVNVSVSRRPHPKSPALGGRRVQVPARHLRYGVPLLHPYLNPSPLHKAPPDGGALCCPTPSRPVPAEGARSKHKHPVHGVPVVLKYKDERCERTCGIWRDESDGLEGTGAKDHRNAAGPAPLSGAGLDGVSHLRTGGGAAGGAGVRPQGGA